MSNNLKPHQWITLTIVATAASLGDACLASSMKAMDPVKSPQQLIFVLADPKVLLGMLLLIIYIISYMRALTELDLSYVLPVTSIGYVVMMLLAVTFLHERVSLTRWLGVFSIVVGVGFVASGPPATSHISEPSE